MVGSLWVCEDGLCCATVVTGVGVVLVESFGVLGV